MEAAALAASAPSERTRLTLGGQVGYGVGQIAGQIFRDIPSLLLLFFLTNVVGMDVALAGAAIFLPKLVFGVGSDFAVGMLSDRLKGRVPRRYWLLVGAVLAPLALTLLFRVPDGDNAQRAAWVIVTFSLYMMVFATFSVPYLAIAGELASNERQRTVLMAWRLVFTAVGVLTAGAVAPALVEQFGGGADGYRQMAVVLSVIASASLLLAFFGIGRKADGAQGVFATPPLRGYATMLYFLTYQSGRADALQVIGVIILSACAGIIAAQPFWVWAAGRFGKPRAFIAGSVIYALSYMVWLLLADQPIWVAYLLAFTAAIGNSGWTVIGFSMLADIAADDADHSGLYSAAWIAADKIAFALGGTLLTGLVLSAFGFDAARAVAGLPQSESAVLGVGLAFGLIPPVLTLIGAAIIGIWARKYPTVG
ncbi:MFS transporter [Blastomonas sp. UPD001]|uniref:MFS transporter n=1 Tax=Blastomonas sp. UPD001 TaxID=2217673 RepID=UPI000E34C831|nr:MFS transporter [Blastomonas sp. UPD001]